MGEILSPLPAQAYFLQPCKEALPGSPKHHLGGGSRKPASCADCDRPLATLLTLDTTDPRLELHGRGLSEINLCTCVSCHETWYTFAPDGEIAPITTSNALSSPGGAELVPPDYCPVRLHAVPDRIVEARTLAAEGRLSEAGAWVKEFDWQSPGNQVGGRPATIGGILPSPKCPLCGKAPRFVATIACAVCDDPRPAEVATAQVLFFLCIECPSAIAIRLEAQRAN